MVFTVAFSVTTEPLIPVLRGFRGTGIHNYPHQAPSTTTTTTDANVYIKYIKKYQTTIANYSRAHDIDGTS